MQYRLGGDMMKRIYARPTLTKARMTLQSVTAVCASTNPDDCIE